MSSKEFFLILLDNIRLYIVIFIGVLSLMSIVLRKKIHSITDPLLIALVMVSFANSVPIFLYALNQISYEKFNFFVISETLFWSGYSFFARNKIDMFDSTRETMTFRDTYRFFLFSVCCIVILQLLCYSIGGIPIFSSSRFSSRQIPIVAIMNRVMIFPKFMCWVFVYHLILNKHIHYKKKILAYITMSILIAFSVLAGSKGFILNALYSYFIYQYMYKGESPEIKWKYILIVILSPLLVISVYYKSNNTMDGFITLISRLVGSGDCYWMGFGNDVIDYINNNAHWYERVFSFILGPLGLISSNAKTPIGTLILNEINPGTVGLLEGPNSRLPIFSWACFGYGGVIFSLLCGMLFAIMAYRKLFSIPRGIVGASLAGLMYINAITMDTDITLCLSGLIDILFGMLLVNVYSLAFCKGIGRIKIAKRN